LSDVDVNNSRCMDIYRPACNNTTPVATQRDMSFITLRESHSMVRSTITDTAKEKWDNLIHFLGL